MNYKISAFFLAAALMLQTAVFPALAAPDWPSDTGIMAESGIVVDADTGAVLFGQNIHQAYAPASITKLLTALVVLEHASLTDMVTFSDDAVNNVESGSGNKISVVPGDTLSVEDCLYAMLLVSSNQAANALAEHVAGSRDAFVQMMNDEIAKIGCTESHFANPSGLNDEAQYVTAYDMALIAREAFANQQLLEIDSSTSRTIAPTANNPEGLTVRMEHRLVITTDTSSDYYYPDAKAGKTGYTSIAGNTLVTYAERDNRHLISVILKGQPRQYFVDGKSLLEFGFTSFQNQPIEGNETSYTTGDTPVTVGDTEYAPSDLMLEPGKTITIPKTAAFTDAQKTLVTGSDLPPGSPELAVGLIRYTYNDRAVGQAYLLAKESAAPSEPTSSGSVPETKNYSSQDEPKTEKEKGTGISWVTVILVILLLILVAGGGGLFFYVKKKEAEELARRRARRRQRLKDENISEEEFKRLMEERKRGKRR